jgi:hypothetical protein
MDVITIGSDTYGKPYGMYANTYCDQVLVPIEFKMENADNSSWTVYGIQPTCNVEADNTIAFGLPTDPLYKTAIDYINTGSCPTSTSNKSRTKIPVLGQKREFKGFMRELRAF